MWKWKALSVAAFLLLLLLLNLQCNLASAQAPKSAASSWQTLTGNSPAVVARGGFSGLFPDSTSAAYIFTYSSGSPDTISWCDVQLTKDGVGLCLSTMLLDNCTNIPNYFPNDKKSYSVNGVQTSGWFSMDYDFSDLVNVSVIQQIFSRTDKFDASSLPILRVEDVQTQVKPPSLWLNMQHDIFYTQHNLSMRSYLLAISRKVVVNYVSSPEVGFLRSVVARFRGGKTKLVFRFLDEDMIEPSMNQTYGSLLKNLTFIKTFAAGILIPKHYIWRVTSDLYLQPHTSVVLDAHKEGLEVFASDFANDALISYNYTYDPLSEYVNFIDNGIFSVDGFLTDFPITASEAIGCFSHLNKNNSERENPVVISHNGASGIYPDCTDLAYQQAVEDGADFIDCPVQVTQDGTTICMSSINLLDDTTVSTSNLRSRSSIIPEIQGAPGIFTFNLTWEEIQKSIKPVISSPESTYSLVRNPRSKNAGNFMKLTDFLAYAKRQALSGILISIERAAFLAENLGYSVVDSVISALEDSGYNNQTVQEVMIQSTNSSVLTVFKQKTKYKLVYKVDESIGSADASSIEDMKKFANSVAVNKQSIYPVSQEFITGQTDVVKNLQSAGFSVFVYLLSNEFVSQAWDFFSDPTVEINSFVQGMGVDGVITDFPGTSTRYRRNSCLKLGDKAPNYMIPVQGGSLLSLVQPFALPPALAPLPVLDASDVVEPPLPSASTKPSVPPAVQPSAAGRQCTAMPVLFASLVTIMLSGSILLLI